MTYPKNTASEIAINIVTSALSSQAIKLSGSYTTEGTAKDYATCDAAYLSKLLTDLQASIEKMGE